jgi:hypothetical protein
MANHDTPLPSTAFRLAVADSSHDSAAIGTDAEQNKIGRALLTVDITAISPENVQQGRRI